MRAIYIPDTFHPIEDLKKLNDELKNVYSIDNTIRVNENFVGGIGGGTILIVDNITRKDKLKILNDINK